MDTSEPSSAEPPSSSSEPPSSEEGPGRERGLSFELVDPDRLLDADLFARTEAAARGVLSRVDTGAARGGEVRARLVDDAAMATAHDEHLGVATTTDVMTFDMTGEPGDGLDVDLLVCVDEARRHAERLGHPVENELALYIVHGVLHCCGHDDATDEGAARMHAEEDRLLAEAGIGIVYAAGGAGPATDGGAR